MSGITKNSNGRYNLSGDQRRRLANNSAAYYQKFGKPMPSLSTLVAQRKMKMSGTNGQAIRTGGWANPTKGGELKFNDILCNAVMNLNDTFSTPILLNGLQSGSDATNRIGRKVNIKSLLLRFNFGMASTSIGGAPCRILVVYDKQANATAPLITDILLVNGFSSQNNLSNRDRFVTIFDHITQPIAATNNYCVADVLFKRVNLETIFNAGNAGTIGDISSGSVYIFVAQCGTIGTTAPVLLARSRIRYTDI